MTQFCNISTLLYLLLYIFIKILGDLSNLNSRGCIRSRDAVFEI